jgi:predicted AAA+ superfamily ATPase
VSLVRGGFPEVLSREPGDRRSAWFRSYISSLLQRDIRDLAHIEGLTAMPRLLGLLAARTSALMNVSELSRSTGIAHATLRRYLGLLEATFILQPLPAWSANLGKRFVKSPKIHLVDSGLAAHLRGETDPRQLAQSSSLGPLLESFVLQEIRKQLGWSLQSAAPYHFRTAAGREVDIVLEAPGGRVAGVEVKAAASVGKGDFAGLETLAETAGKRFVKGIVIYLGEHTVPYGDLLWAVPIDELWR